MALYTGVNAYIKIKDVSPEVIIKVGFYDDYKSHIEFSDKYGGYPKFHYMLDFLGIDEWMEDTDENYENIHKLYTEEINQMEHVVNEIEKHNLLEKVKREELYFITRNYELAKMFGKVLNQSEFYFRKAVSYDKLFSLLEQCKDVYDFSWIYEKANDLKNDYIFEVHVS